MPGAAATSGLAGPGAAAAAHCPCWGRKEDQEWNHTASPRSTLASSSRRPALRAPWQPLPLPLWQARAPLPRPAHLTKAACGLPGSAPPPPLRVVSCSVRAAREWLAPPCPHSTQLGARARSRSSLGDSSGVAPQSSARAAPPLPGPAPLPRSSPHRQSRRGTSLSRWRGRGQCGSITPFSSRSSPAPRDLCATRLNRSLCLGAALLKRVLVPHSSVQEKKRRD